MILKVKQFSGRFVIQTNERPSRYFHCSYPDREHAQQVCDTLSSQDLSTLVLDVNFSYSLKDVVEVFQYEKLEKQRSESQRYR
jgi:hypothetical protein